jgi:hypothetical protein
MKRQLVIALFSFIIAVSYHQGMANETPETLASEIASTLNNPNWKEDPAAVIDVQSRYGYLAELLLKTKIQDYSVEWQKVFVSIAKNSIDHYLKEFVREFQHSSLSKAVQVLNKVETPLSQITIARILGGVNSQAKENVQVVAIPTPESLPEKPQDVPENVLELINNFVNKVLNDVLKQYQEATRFEAKQIGLTEENSDPTDTRLININLFSPETNYLDPEKAELRFRPGGGTYTAGLWELKVNTSHPKLQSSERGWRRQLLIKSVKSSAAKGELEALFELRRDPIISQVSIGKNVFLNGSPKQKATYLPQFTFDVAQYQVSDHDAKTHYLTVLGLAKGKPITDYFIEAVEEALTQPKEQIFSLPKVKLFVTAMQAYGRALSQFHQATNKCKKSSPSPSCYLYAYAHGDGHFENVFYDTRLNKIFLIDNATMALSFNPALTVESPFEGLVSQIQTEENEFGMVSVFDHSRDPETNLISIRADVSYFYLRPMTWFLEMPRVESIFNIMAQDKVHEKHLLNIFIEGVESFLKAYVNQYPFDAQERVGIVFEDFKRNIHNKAFELIMKEEGY